MTAAAMLLAWFEPNTPGFDVVEDPSLARERARMVLENVTGLDQLSGILVTLKSRDAGSPSTLAAVKAGGPEFVVVANGMAHALATGASRRDRRMMIELPCPADAADISMAQWIGLQTLIEEIHARRNQDLRLVPLHVDGAANVGDAVGAVRGLLDMDGWVVR